MVAVSAGMSGTRGSGVLSSTGDVLVRGVGGVCGMSMCFARGGVGGEGDEWMRELGLGLPILWVQGECWTCVCVLVAVVWVVWVVWVVYVGSGLGAWTRVGSGVVVLCLCEV